MSGSNKNLADVVSDILERFLTDAKSTTLPDLVGVDAMAMGLYIRALGRANTLEEKAAIGLRIERLLENIEIFRRDVNRDAAIDAILNLVATFVRVALVSLA